jgi:hypothetical protein
MRRLLTLAIAIATCVIATADIWPPGASLPGH